MPPVRLVDRSSVHRTGVFVVLRRAVLRLLSVLAVVFCDYSLPPQGAAAPSQSSGIVTTVSAANYAPVLAPDSIAAAFASPGIRLATRTEDAKTLPLPTTLAGTTVKINGELARLFFVSPEQVNYVIPAGTPAGLASVVITCGDGTVATGTVQIAPVAPALFTANSNGQGVLAASLLRVKANGKQEWEAVARYDDKNKIYLTQPIDFGEASDQLFLVLFMTGIRQAGASNVRVSIGGVEYAPLFVGPQGEYAGLDQINVALPRSFSGRGRITLLVKAAGYGASNAGVFEIGAGAEAGSPLQITSLNPATVRASDDLLIAGSGFAGNPRENRVQIVADDGVATKADVLSVTNALRVRLPFGAGTGQLKLSRGQSEASTAINVRTSISGFVENTKRLRLEGVKISIPGTSLSTMTDANGSFVLPDLNPQEAVVFEVDARNIPGHDRLFHKTPARADRDNQYPDPISLQQITVSGTGLLSSTTALTLTTERSADSPPAAGTEAIQSGAISFDLPANVTTVEKSLLPASLPVGHFSSTVAQITPFGTKFTPGGKLTFPNCDNLPAGRQATLFKFDQTPGSATLGTFIAVGAATVSADGQRVETTANAITEGTYYFVSIERPLAAINGRVLESDGRPVPRAIVRVRGQSTFTDGHGGFVLRNVPVLKASGDKVQVEVSYQRPDGRIARKDGSEVELTAGALATVKPEIVLDAVTTKLPPVILAPSTLTLTAGETREFDFIASDPDSTQSLQVTASGTAMAFTTLSEQEQRTYRLKMTPAANAAGSYTLNLVATDSVNESSHRIAVIVNPPDNSKPTAQSQSVTTPEDTRLALTLKGNDPGGKPLSYTIITAPARGCFIGTDPNVCLPTPTNLPNVIYKPGLNFNGTDSFTFKVSNGSAESAVTTVFIAVSAVNDMPVLSVPRTLSVNAGETLNLVVTATDVDGDQALTITATGLPPGATLTEAGGTSRLLSWTPTFTLAGTSAVSITVTDNGSPALSDTKTLTITADARWARTSGPEGGYISALLNASAGLFAGTSGGIYHSSNTGQSWVASNNGLPNGALQSIHTLLESQGNLYVGTHDGIYRSSDNGQNWVASSKGSLAETPFVNTLVARGGNLYAGTFFGGIQCSSDNGKNWVAINNGLPDDALFVNALVVQGDNLYAGTYGGIYRSSDNGKSWIASNNGLPDDELVVTALVASGESLLAGTYRGKVYRSNDKGQTWVASNNGLRGHSVTALAESSESIYVTTSGGGIYRSSDNGQNWKAIGNNLLDLALVVNTLLVSGGSLYIGTYEGLYHSIDNGGRWNRIVNGISASYVETLQHTSLGILTVHDGGQVSYTTTNGQRWDPIDKPRQVLTFSSLIVSGGNWYAGTYGGGIYRSSDKGQSWKASNDGLPGFAWSIYTLTGSGGSLFAGTSGGIYRSSDNGQSWVDTNNGVTGLTAGVYTIVMNGESLFTGGKGGIYRSSDNGQTWEACGNGLSSYALRTIRSLQIIGGNLYVGTLDGVYRSSDNAQTWVSINGGLPFQALFVNTLVVNGGSLFAGTGGGIYRLSDNGQSWISINKGLPYEDLWIETLVVSGGNLFVGIYGGGVYRTSDNGQNWVACNDGLTDFYVTSVVAVNGNLFAWTSGSGAYRSSDNGQHWVAGNQDLPSEALSVNTLMTSNGSIYTGTSGGGIYRSSDNGQSWVASNNGLTGYAYDVRTLVANGNSLYAGTARGFYRSSDGGKSWMASNKGLSGEALVVRHLLVNDSNLIAGTGNGIYRSRDKGQSWVASNNGLPSTVEVQTLLASNGSIFAGTYGDGIYRSEDNGQTWVASNNGLPDKASSVTSLGISSGNLFAGTSDGLYRSSNNGQTWYPFKSEPAFHYAPSLTSDGTQLFVGTAGAGVFLLSNNNQSWAESNLGLTNKLANAVAVNGNNLFVGTVGGGVFRSSDQGQNWTTANRGLPANTNIQSLVANGATLWTATFGDGVYRLSDDGANWTAVNNGLTNKLVNKLFLLGSTLYAGTDGGLFRSTDGGVTWSADGLTNQRVVSFVAKAGVLFVGTDGNGVFRRNAEGGSWTPIGRGLTNLFVTALGLAEGVLYAGTNGGGICLSRDDGETWMPINNQLPPTLNVYAFAVSGKKVYAGSIYGVFVTEDEGQNWQQVNAGLLSVYVTSLAVSGQTLLAGTLQGGVFVSQIPEP